MNAKTSLKPAYMTMSAVQSAAEKEFAGTRVLFLAVKIRANALSTALKLRTLIDSPALVMTSAAQAFATLTTGAKRRPIGV